MQQAVLSERALELNVTNEGGIDRTYRLLKNIMGLWLVQECKRSFERRGKTYDYAQLTRLASQSRTMRSLVNPDDRAFLNPDDMASALQKWCGEYGEPVPQTEGELIRCALESLAFKYRMVLEWLEELTGTRIEVVHIVGGGCQNEALNQLTADACGRPVVAGPVEATVGGQCLDPGPLGRRAEIAGRLAPGGPRIDAAAKTLRTPGARTAAWNDAYPRFIELVAKSARNAAV